MGFVLPSGTQTWQWNISSLDGGFPSHVWLRINNNSCYKNNNDDGNNNILIYIELYSTNIYIYIELYSTIYSTNKNKQEENSNGKINKRNTSAKQIDYNDSK